MQTVAEQAPNATDYPIADWVEQFHRDGYLVLPDILSGELIKELKRDLDEALDAGGEGCVLNEALKFHVQNRMFERSAANVSLFDLEPIVSFAEALIAPDCHVIHNNSFKIGPGGGINVWHQDDAPHLLVLDGEPPTNIRLPVLLFTANYYLTDVDEPKYGPTEVIPGSHMFGKACPPVLEGTEWESRITPALGKAGSVVMFNNQVWHRGGNNTSDRTRYITQVSYARRLVGHKYYPFMNYQMPEHVYAGADARLKRLLGFLPSGAYG